MEQYYRKNLLSKENIKYSLIFILLSIVFLYFVRGPLLILFSKTEIAKEIHFFIIPLNLEGILFWLIFASTFTPYIIFIYKRKYEIFILGFLIPSLIINIYTYSLVGLHLDAIYIEWSFWNLIPSFVLIYLLRRSKNPKEDLISIVFFVLLSKLLSLCSLIYCTGYCSSIVDLFCYVSFSLFAAAYLILLSFAVEKIAKIKIFRHEYMKQ